MEANYFSDPVDQNCNFVEMENLTKMFHEALTLQKQKKYEKALSIYESLMDPFRSKLGPSDSETRELQKNLVSCYKKARLEKKFDEALTLQNSKKYQKAILLYESLFESYKQICGPSDPDTILVGKNLEFCKNPFLSQLKPIVVCVRRENLIFGFLTAVLISLSYFYDVHIKPTLKSMDGLSLILTPTFVLMLVGLASVRVLCRQRKWLFRISCMVCLVMVTIFLYHYVDYEAISKFAGFLGLILLTVFVIIRLVTGPENNFGEGRTRKRTSKN